MAEVLVQAFIMRQRTRFRRLACRSADSTSCSASTPSRTSVKYSWIISCIEGRDFVVVTIIEGHRLLPHDVDPDEDSVPTSWTRVITAPMAGRRGSRAGTVTRGAGLVSDF